MTNRTKKTTAQKPLLKSRTIWANVSAIISVLGLVILEIANEVQLLNTALAANGTEVDFLRYTLAGLTIAGSVVSIYARIDDRVRKGR